MAISTVYDVKVKYSLNDRASRGVKGLTRQTNMAAAAAKRASAAFTFLKRAAIAGGIFAAVKGVKAIIGINVELEKTKNQIRTLLQLNLGGDLATNTQRAGRLLAQFREDAKEIPGTFQDMAAFSGRIAGNITRAGGSMEDLRVITKGGVLAATLFNQEAGKAALDIKQALTGRLTARDDFILGLIEPFLKAEGITQDFAKSWNKMVKAEPGKAIVLLNKVFSGPAIKDAAKDFRTSFAGVSSTLRSNLEQFGEKVGKPLFEELTKQIIAVNAFFENNQDKVKSFAKSVGNSLVKAFELAKATFSFLFKHRDLLMTLAKAFIAFKGAQVLAQPFLLLSQVSGVAATRMGQFGVALGLGIAAIKGIEGFFNRQLDKRQKVAVDTVQAKANARLFAGGVTAKERARAKVSGRAGASDRDIRFQQAQTLIRAGQSFGAINKRGQIDASKIAKGFGVSEFAFNKQGGRRATDQNVKEAKFFNTQLTKALKEFGPDVLKEQRRGLDESFARLRSLPTNIPGASTGGVPSAAAPNMSVGKMVFNVQSDDPDRFAIALEGIFQDLLANGGQAATTQFEGGSR